MTPLIIYYSLLDYWVLINQCLKLKERFEDIFVMISYVIIYISW